MTMADFFVPSQSLRGFLVNEAWRMLRMKRIDPIDSYDAINGALIADNGALIVGIDKSDEQPNDRDRHAIVQSALVWSVRMMIQLRKEHALDPCASQDALIAAWKYLSRLYHIYPDKDRCEGEDLDCCAYHAIDAEWDILSDDLACDKEAMHRRTLTHTAMRHGVDRKILQIVVNAWLARFEDQEDQEDQEVTDQDLLERYKIYLTYLATTVMRGQGNAMLFGDDLFEYSASPYRSSPEDPESLSGLSRVAWARIDRANEIWQAPRRAILACKDPCYLENLCYVIPNIGDKRDSYSLANFRTLVNEARREDCLKIIADWGNESAIGVQLVRLSDAVLDMIGQCINREAIDEQEVYKIEDEWRDEAWAGEYRKEFKHGVIDRLESALETADTDRARDRINRALRAFDGLDDNALYSLFHHLCSERSIYIEIQGDSAYIDMDQLLTMGSHRARYSSEVDPIEWLIAALDPPDERQGSRPMKINSYKRLLAIGQAIGNQMRAAIICGNGTCSNIAVISTDDLPPFATDLIDLPADWQWSDHRLLCPHCAIRARAVEPEQ